VLVAHPSAQGGVWFLSTIMRDLSEWKKLDRMKNEFVSTVSHELRTPLTSIRGALGLLEAGVTGALSDKGIDLVHVARENCERLIRLINDMLDLDKIEAGVLSLDLVDLAPADVVQATLDGIAGMAVVYGIRLEQVVASTPMIRVDRDRIVQVLTNLVSNAIKFSPTGSAVSVAVTATNDRVRFAVENPGQGIPTADREKLFRRFQQLDGADNRQRGGTGLGLAIAKAIVEQHEGRIGFESEPGVRTTFWVDLPLHQARAR
jgi:signal transduction histidine kinase